MVVHGLMKSDRKALMAICDNCGKVYDYRCPYTESRKNAWCPVGWMRLYNDEIYCKSCYLLGLARASKRGIKWVDGYEIEELT